MVQDLESEVNFAGSLSVKEIITYRGYTLKLYLASLNQLILGPDEQERYKKALQSMNLPQRLYFLDHLKKESAFLHNRPLADYFRKNYIAINGGRNDTRQENKGEFFHSRALVSIKGNKK